MQQTCWLSVLVLLWQSLEIIRAVRLLDASIIMLMHIATTYINGLLHFLSCSKGLLKTMLISSAYLMMLAVSSMLRKKMTGQLLFCERLLGKLLLEHLMMVWGTVVAWRAIALKVKQVDNLARRCRFFQRVACRESIAATAEFVIKYVHLHLLLHWKVLLVEFLLGDWFAQAGDALGGRGLRHGFVASVDAEVVHLFALSVVEIILLVSWGLLGGWHNNQMLLLLIALLRCFLSSAAGRAHIWTATVALRLLKQFELIFNKFGRPRAQMLLCLFHGCLTNFLVKP